MSYSLSLVVSAPVLFLLIYNTILIGVRDNLSLFVIGIIVTSIVAILVAKYYFYKATSSTMNNLHKDRVITRFKQVQKILYSKTSDGEDREHLNFELSFIPIYIHELRTAIEDYNPSDVDSSDNLMSWGNVMSKYIDPKFKDSNPSDFESDLKDTRNIVNKIREKYPDDL